MIERMKVVLVHELLTMRGGAERVLRVLADMFPDAPIYTLLYDEKKLGDWFPASRVRVSNAQMSSFLSPKSFFRFNHHLHLSRFPSAVEAWDFSDFDLVISTSSAFAHGIITNGKPKHLCYVHSPARYLWDRTHDVLDRAGRGLLGPLKRWHLEKTFHKLRIWDTESADRPDHLIAASKTVQRRIELYWRRKSNVIHPPIDDFWFRPSDHPTIGPSDHPYYLIVSTLAPYKRIELAIEACNQSKQRLIIAGEGPAKKYLMAISGPTIEFAGYRTEPQLRELYTEAKATIFPGDEDFGLVPLESLACGTPVIAYGSGGALETLEDGVTGAFFREPTAASLIKAMQNCERMTFDSVRLIESARRFGRAEFERKMREKIEGVMVRSEASQC